MGKTASLANIGTIADSSLGFRNRIINGAMVIDQRNAGAAKSVSVATDTYCLDRFAVYSAGAGCTVQQVSSGVTGVPFVMQITGAASVSGISFAQKIESKNISDCAGSAVTLSALISNSLLTTVNWIAYYANSVDNFASVTQIATGSFTVTSTLTQYSTQITLPANAVNGVQITFSVGAQTSGTFKVTNIQLEKGSTATSFDYRPIGTELALCQRYLPVVYITGGFNFMGQAYTSALAAYVIPFAVQVRTPPTGIITGGTIYGTTATGTSAGGTLTISTTTVDHAEVRIGGATGLVAGNCTSLSTATTTSIQFTGCEL